MAKKTMYTASKSLAEYIAKNEQTDSLTLWSSWVGIYKPTDDMIPELKRLCYNLSELDKNSILSVPEYTYREKIKKCLKLRLSMEDNNG